MNRPHRYTLLDAAEVKPYERNPRTHTPEQIEQLRASIREFGFTNPLLVDELGQLIAGHGRLEAALAEGMAQIPSIIVAGLSEPQRRALVLADNQLATKSAWDPERLLFELQALEPDAQRFAGFDDAEISALIATVEKIGLSLADNEWTGMPEFQNDPIAFRSIIVHFKSAEDVLAFEQLIQQSFSPETKSAWYPARARETIADKAYVAA